MKTEKETAIYMAKVGIDQIPDDGLQRLVKYIDDGKPLLLTGSVADMQDSGAVG